jgi:hypothetical protein
LAEISPLGPIVDTSIQLDALLSLRVRGGLEAFAFTCPAQEGTSAGFIRAGVSVYAPASLSEFTGLLSSVNACMLFSSYYPLNDPLVK